VYVEPFLMFSRGETIPVGLLPLVPLCPPILGLFYTPVSIRDVLAQAGVSAVRVDVLPSVPPKGDFAS